MKINIPYYHDRIVVDIPDHRMKAILKPKAYSQIGMDESYIVKTALQHPIESPPLAELTAGKNNILIITSDHTRPVPSRITLPILLSHIRQGNQHAVVKILIATGFHRATTDDELRDKLGDDICDHEDIIVHDAFDASSMVSKGILPSGGELRINKLVNWAELIVSEGFIEPHFFAGFSGGRKSILPGICAQDTIMYNHNAQFINHPSARTGRLANNPLHTDMLSAAKTVGLSFILNVAIGPDKKIIAAFSGDPVAAHLTGCEFVRAHTSVSSVKANLVVTSNGGYPLDQNVYQTVKGMTAAESCVNPGGVIIMISSCVDGHGGNGFYRWLANAESAEEVALQIHAIPRDKTSPDQWEAQILARILTKCKAVIIVSQHVDPQLIADMHIRHALTFEEALNLADELLGYKTGLVIIPDGVGVIIEEH